MKAHYPLILKTIIVSVVFHYLFIMFFPKDFLDHWLSIEFDMERNAGVVPPIEVLLEGKSSNGIPSDKLQQDGVQIEGEIAAEGNLQGVDQEKWGELIANLEKNTGFKEGFKQTYEDLSSKKPVSSQYIFRDRKHEDIVVKDVFPTIHNIDQHFEEILNAAPERLEEFDRRNEIIEQYRDPKVSDRADLMKVDFMETTKNGTLGPLDFPAPARQQYFDQTLVEDKTLQLSNFINKYYDYDPNKGDLPIATRELYYQNLERLLYSYSSDPTYFYLDYYFENLNKEDFLFNALNKASKLNGTKTATELLFIIEEIYHIQQRAWRSYFDFEAIYPRISEQKRDRLRVETLRRVGERYKEILEKKEIKNFQEIEQKYLQRRLEIIEHIINHTPQAYRLEDALFERAAILWQIGMRSNDKELKNNAISQWQSLIHQSKKPGAAQNNKEMFVNFPHVDSIALLLTKYQAASGIKEIAVEKEIYNFLLKRNSKRIAAKREREERLLWPKNK